MARDELCLRCIMKEGTILLLEMGVSQENEFFDLLDSGTDEDSKCEVYGNSKEETKLWKRTRTDRMEMYTVMGRHR